MTVKELKDILEKCNDADFVTMCGCRDDNPVLDSYDVDVVYKINKNCDNITQICLMPN